MPLLSAKTVNTAIALLAAVVSASAAAGHSTQDNYPWGHQLLHLFCNLDEAGPLEEQAYVETGWEKIRESSLPVTGEERTLVKIPFGFGCNISQKAKMELQWEALYHTEAGHPYRFDPGDLRWSTAYHILSDPAVSVKVLTKLPNAPNTYDIPQLPESGGLSGAGTDMTDFHLLVLASKKFKKTSVHANAGFLILGDPLANSRQLDLGTLALGVGHSFGKASLLAQFNATKGPRYYDDIRTLGLSTEYGFLPFLFVAVGGTYPFNSSSDDFRLSVNLKYKNKGVHL